MMVLKAHRHENRHALPATATADVLINTRRIIQATLAAIHPWCSELEASLSLSTHLACFMDYSHCHISQYKNAKASRSLFLCVCGPLWGPSAGKLTLRPQSQFQKWELRKLHQNYDNPLSEITWILTIQQSRNRRASTGVVKFSPHSLSCLESFQCTKHSDAWVILVPAWTWKNTLGYMYVVDKTYINKYPGKTAIYWWL